MVLTHRLCRAVTQGQADRVNYLMTRQAKVVAMTCTHAALKRRDFLDLAFKYDNLLLEEAAQILEIETFLPMLLQVRGLTSLHRPFRCCAVLQFACSTDIHPSFRRPKWLSLCIYHSESLTHCSPS